MEKPKRICSRPGCRGIVSGDVCSICGPRRVAPDRRIPAAARGYDRAWQSRREQFLASHPLCEVCGARGWIRPARIAHHIEAVSGGHEVIVDDEQLVAVCSQACHDLIEPLGRGWRAAIAARSRNLPPGGGRVRSNAFDLSRPLCSPRAKIGGSEKKVASEKTSGGEKDAG
jgi:5-methylcytosine-specific restriction enzyme A